MDNKIGFVVWGIRNGFKNNWLSANVDAGVYQLLTDDMRQICNSTVDKFYSIEKIENWTVLSIFNPNTKDHVQRKAYIALSIVIPNGYVIIGDALGSLNSMLQTYEVKQGNAMVNMVNADDVKAHLAGLQLNPESNFASHTGNGIGVFHYTDFNQIQLHFSNPTIFGFKKVFFISSQNVALERIPGIQNVESFAKPLFFTVSEFDPNRHNATINGQSITMSKTQVKQGDVIRVADLKTKQSKEFQITNKDENISLRALFPRIDKQPEPPTNNRIKIIALFSIAVLIIGGMMYYFMSSETIEAGGGTGPVVEETSDKVFSAIYDFKQLELQNFPVAVTNANTEFNIYRLNNDSSLLDAVSNADPKTSKVELKRLSDTILVIRYKVDGKLQTERISVEFRLPSEHKIKSGESLSKIAERYGVKKDSLMKWNKISNENAIREDQSLALKSVVSKTKIVEEPRQTESPKNDNNQTNLNANKHSASANGNATVDSKKNGISDGLTKPNNSTSELENVKKEIDELIKDLSTEEGKIKKADKLRCGDDLVKLKALRNKLK